MNIAFFIKPKSAVAFVYEDNSLRQGLEKMKHHRYSAVPVITREGKYVGAVKEGDFLWVLRESDDPRREEKTRIREIMRQREPVRITAGMDDLLLKVMDQNFVSVVDDADSFVGIITRRDIMHYYYQKIKLLDEGGSGKGELQ